MKTLVIANQKGGVGKTATTVHLAFDFYQRKGVRVAVIDLDTQANASFSLKNFKVGLSASQLLDQDSEALNAALSSLPKNGPVLALIESSPTLVNIESHSLRDVSSAFTESISLLSDHFDVVLIDTAPVLGKAMISALYSAEYVLSPIDMAAYSMQGIEKMLTTVRNVRKSNQALSFLGMLPSRVDNRSPLHKSNLAELKAKYSKLMVPAVIGLRSSIEEALASSIPVWEIKKTAARKASAEIWAVADYVFKEMNIELTGEN